MSFAPGHWTMSPRGRGYRSSGDTGEAGGGGGCVTGTSGGLVDRDHFTAALARPLLQ